MKKNVLIFGFISGAIITAMAFYAVSMITSGEEFKSNDVLGYAIQIAAFAFIFAGIKNFRDKYNQGVINFGKAFKIGLYITLIASTIYVVTWLINYYFFVPDFMDHYTACVMREAKADGATQAELNKKAMEMADFSEMYKNPLFVILITYSEVFPIGLVVSLVSALLLKRKVKT